MKTFTQSLIHRVTFQRQVAERDSEGVLQVSWQDVWLDSETALIDVPAEVLTGPGREFLQSGQMQSDVAARFRGSLAESMPAGGCCGMAGCSTSRATRTWTPAGAVNTGSSARPV